MLYIGIQIHIIRYKDKIHGGVDMGLKQRLTAVGEFPWKHSVITINDGCDLCAENCTAVVGCTGGDASSEIVLKKRPETTVSDRFYAGARRFGAVTTVPGG